MRVNIGPHPKIGSKKRRKVDVVIHDYDVWNMDATLALLIIPMLHKLKATKQGAPHVDDEDVPEHLRSTAAPPKERPYDADANYFKRWDWVIDEIIWAFEQEYLDENDEGHWNYYDKYAEGEPTEPLMPIRILKDDGSIEEKERSFETAEDEAAYRALGKYNKERHLAYSRRVKHAMTLFGKHFQSLWD